MMNFTLSWQLILTAIRLLFHKVEIHYFDNVLAIHCNVRKPDTKHQRVTDVCVWFTDRIKNIRKEEDRID